MTQHETMNLPKLLGKILGGNIFCIQTAQFFSMTLEKVTVVSQCLKIGNICKVTPGFYSVPLESFSAHWSRGTYHLSCASCVSQFTHRGGSTSTHHSHSVVSYFVWSGHLLTESPHPVLCLLRSGAVHIHYRVSPHLPVSCKRRLSLGTKVHNKLSTLGGQ